METMRVLNQAFLLTLLLTVVAAKSTSKKYGHLSSERSVKGLKDNELSDPPSMVPSDMPSMIPGDKRSDIPSDAPSDVPSDVPSSIPTYAFSDPPSSVPTFLAFGAQASSSKKIYCTGSQGMIALIVFGTLPFLF